MLLCLCLAFSQYVWGPLSLVHSKVYGPGIGITGQSGVYKPNGVGHVGEKSVTSQAVALR